MPILKKKQVPPKAPPPPPLPVASSDLTNGITAPVRVKPPVPVKPKALLGINQSDSGRESADDSQTDLDGHLSNVSLNSNANNESEVGVAVGVVSKTPPPESKNKKGSKLRRALTSNSLTLSRLAGKNKRSKRSSVEETTASGQELRDGGLWRLPGMEDPRQPVQDETSTEEMKYRELPPLPSSEEADPSTVVETPPSLPARPHPPESPETRRPSDDHDVQGIPPAPDESTLQGALDKYPGCYPIRFRVLQGYCNDSSDVNMSTDDVYDIHLVKETKVVIIKGDSGAVHRVPLGSPQKLGIIHNPNNDFSQGLEGHIFKSVADITAATPLPKVVMATQEARSQDGKYLCLEGEVLVVLGVHRTLFKGRRGLKVYSLESRVEKVLPEDCHAYFTTNPSLVRLHLPEILQLVPTPFPCQAVMYSGGDQPTVRGVVTLLECSTETSLVASAVAYDENLEPVDQSDSSPELFDLPLDNEMRELEVSILQVTSRGDQSDCSSCSSDHTYDDTLVVPREATNVRSQDFVIPNEESQVLVGSTFSDIRDNVFDQDEDDRYDTVGLHLVSPGPGHYGNEGYDELHRVTGALETRVASLEERNQEMLSQLSSKIQAVETQLQALASRPMGLQTQEGKCDTEQLNREFVAKLSVRQVAQVFEGMGLGGVKGRLHDEQVSGDILLEFDDDILREELGMVSRIQRIRVMKVIRGQHSVNQLLTHTD